MTMTTFGPVLPSVKHGCHETVVEDAKPGSVPWRVYLLRCVDGSLYCGITVNFEKRFFAHQSGTASKYTRSRLPVELSLITRELSETSARKVEAAIKRLKKEYKLSALMECADPEFEYELYCNEGDHCQRVTC